MGVRVCEREVWLPAPVEEVFAFFSDASNLARLTPPWLRFEILTAAPISMGSGALIDYRISLRGLPMKWQTEILDWVPNERFSDRQIKGPYRLWHHTHEFQSAKGGTQMNDRVEYIVPGGVLEPLIFPFVRRDVERIFDFRTEVIRSIFPDPATAK